jgi:cobalt-zinc-cadmium efflux system outer membrane protein
LLQAQVEAHQAGVALRNAQRRYRRDWEHLVTLIGAPEMPPAPLAGELEPKGPPLDWESALHRVLEESPEVQFAQAEVVRDQITVQREQVEPIPNIRVQGGVGRDSQIGEQGAVGTVQVGITLPIFNRNQGTIREAKAEVVRAQAEVARVELSLRRRLADTFERYANALDAVQTSRENTLPKAQRALELYMDYFRKQRRATWPQVLVAQRTYFQLQESYVDALVQLRRAEVTIKGLLVVDGMTQPPEPTPQGHINANPNPR